MLDPDDYPVLSRYEYLTPEELAESIANMDVREKAMAEQEAEELMGHLARALAPFIEGIEGMAAVIVKAFNEVYDSMPQEVKDELKKQSESTHD